MEKGIKIEEKGVGSCCKSQEFWQYNSSKQIQ
jgi:hypothetical protein